MEKGFLIFLVSYKGTGDLCIPSTKPGTQERWDPALVSYHVNHQAHCLVLDDVCTACPITSHIPWPADQMWSSFAQQCLYFPPSLILFLAGLRTYLDHKGALIMLSYKGMLLGAGCLVLKVVFLFITLLFCLCARLVVKVLRSSQRELLGNGLFFLQKFLVFIKLPYVILLSCLCQYTSTVWRYCFSFSLLPHSPWVSYFSPCASTCILVLFPYPYLLPPLHKDTERIVGVLTI